MRSRLLLAPLEARGPTPAKTLPMNAVQSIGGVGIGESKRKSRLNCWAVGGRTLGGLVQFHTIHKLVLMAHSRKAYGELADSSPTRSVWPRAGRALSEEISDFGCKVVAQYATTTLQTPFLHGARDQCGISQNRVSEACQGGAAALRLDCRANRPTER